MKRSLVTRAFGTASSVAAAWCVLWALDRLASALALHGPTDDILSLGKACILAFGGVVALKAGRSWFREADQDWTNLGSQTSFIGKLNNFAPLIIFFLISAVLFYAYGIWQNWWACQFYFKGPFNLWELNRVACLSRIW